MHFKLGSGLPALPFLLPLKRFWPSQASRAAPTHKASSFCRGYLDCLGLSLRRSSPSASEIAKHNSQVDSMIAPTRCRQLVHFGMLPSCYLFPSHGWSGRLSVLCASLGVQQAIMDLRSPESRALKTNIDSATPNFLSIFQLSGFMVATVWSSSYVVMIHIEMRRCSDSSGAP